MGSEGNVLLPSSLGVTTQKPIENAGDTINRPPQMHSDSMHEDVESELV